MSSILFLGKAGDAYSEKARQIVSARFPQSLTFSGKRGDVFPKAAQEWRGDYLISYLSPWVVPESLLKQASKAAINFHPGPPEYPGIGCTNFAIFNNEQEFGVTCHHMVPAVDSGAIIAVRRFPLKSSDSVFSLTQRCYEEIWALFNELLPVMEKHQSLPSSQETWTRRAYTRKELNDLCRLDLRMSPEEIQRRVRATTFPGYPGAYFEVDGLRFEYVPQQTVLN
jgi:methionyl-tRNA formyltransferase